MPNCVESPHLATPTSNPSAFHVLIKCRKQNFTALIFSSGFTYNINLSLSLRLQQSETKKEPYFENILFCFEFLQIYILVSDIYFLCRLKIISLKKPECRLKFLIFLFVKVRPDWRANYLRRHIVHDNVAGDSHEPVHRHLLTVLSFVGQ